MKWCVFIVVVVLGGSLMSCSQMGSSPDSEDKEKFKQSLNFNTEKKTFNNRRQELIEKMWKKNFKLKNIFSFFKKRKDASPSKSLPEVKPDIEEFLKPSQKLKVIWFGHSSFLLNMDGKIILVDPVFSGSAAPVSFIVKRFQAPVLSLEELPSIDYVLISHDHYDHLDMQSIKCLARKNKKITFVTPLGVGAHLKGWGVEAEQIIERDWWQSTDFEGVEFIATPAQHFSGRGLFDRNKTLWASWVIRSESHNIYFSGDSGYDTHFKKIGEKFGPFDVAFIESGQYNEKWPEVHMMPKDALKAYEDLNAKKYFPVHWGMFVLSYHTWFDPMEQLFKLSKQSDVELVVPKIGEVVDFSKSYVNDFWWNQK